ncbi:MAG TPA: hypothetical protein VKE70_32105 [Candidatus Solibacter sp.]|nr:hypothetical protein [Candidatus Solibacter sp.]
MTNTNGPQNTPGYFMGCYVCYHFFRTCRPANDTEFTTPGNQGDLKRNDLHDGPAGQAVSLSYVDHTDSGLMSPTLATGIRAMPMAVIDQFFAGLFTDLCDFGDFVAVAALLAKSGRAATGLFQPIR